MNATLESRNIKGEWITKEEFVLKNIGLVHKVCQKYKNRGFRMGLEYDEIVNVGVIGLIKAYGGYDNSFNCAVSTYAAPMIAGYILQHLRDYNPGAKFSRTIKDIAFKVTGDETAKEISEKFEITLKAAEDILTFKKNAFSLSMQQTSFDIDEGQVITIEDTLPSHQDTSSVFVNEFIESMHDERFKVIIRGLMEEKSQREIGVMIGCTQIHVSRLLKRIRLAYLEYEKGSVGA